MKGVSGKSEQSGKSGGHSGKTHSHCSKGECTRLVHTSPNLECLQHFVVGHTDPKRPTFRFGLSLDEARNSCMGKTSPVPSLPETALLRYVPMVGRSDDSASNPGMLIFTPFDHFQG